jgi:hypothetical protein
MPEAQSESLDEVATRSSSWCNTCILMLWPTSMCKGLPVMVMLLGSASGGAAYATLVKMLRGMTATDVERTPTLSLTIPIPPGEIRLQDNRYAFYHGSKGRTKRSCAGDLHRPCWAPQNPHHESAVDSADSDCERYSGMASIPNDRGSPRRVDKDCHLIAGPEAS